MTDPRPDDTFGDTFDEEKLDDDVDIEAPEADVLEQHTSTREESSRAARRETPFEANDADAAEQDRVADTDDDDDYR